MIIYPPVNKYTVEELDTSKEGHNLGKFVGLESSYIVTLADEEAIDEVSSIRLFDI